MLVAVLILSIFHTELREAFQRSAIGHISYMMIRLAPIYKAGSMYIQGIVLLNRYSSL